MSPQNQDDKHTPSDNGGQKTQNSSMEGASNPKASGTNFDEIQREAFESRESGLNESGKENKPTRDRDGVGSNRDKSPGQE